MPAVSAPRAPAWTARLPAQCEVCRSWGRAGLCRDCDERFGPAVPRCAQCAIETPAGVERCGECLRDPPPFRRTVCIGTYAFPWSRLITAFKFEQRPELAGALARVLHDRLRRDGVAWPDLVVPVPLSEDRLAERGYNQAWELARRLAAACGTAARAEVLVRRFDAAPQAGLTRPERLANARGSFRVGVREAARLRGCQVALVDDVMTTGATAREAASVLLASGAGGVDVWVLARTAAE